MIVDSAAAFTAAIAARGWPAIDPPTARAAFLVAPDGFRLAHESAQDNRYMVMGQGIDADRARAQHAELLRRLSASLPCIAFPGDPDCPDGLFPNNVYATRAGRLVVGRMRHAVRRREAQRSDIRRFFTDVAGYELVDLSQQGFVAELTGSLVIDRARRIGYCGLSERCDRAGAEAMHEAFGLELTFCFDLSAAEYHTNVVLAVLAGRAALIAADGFADPAVPAAIAACYDGRAIGLDPAQKTAFAANAISLNENSVWMSEVARRSFREDQVARLAQWGFRIESVVLDEIEKAGGSLRCCVAEIF